MTTHIAFLRAINVGGRRVSMGDLAAEFESLELDEVTTYQASGNVSFTSERPATELETAVAAQLERELGYDVPTIVRSLAELEVLCASPVFAEEAQQPNCKLYVSFVTEPMGAEHVAALAELGNGVDSFARVERDVFWLRDIDAGESMTNSDLEKALGVVATRRTIATVQKIVAKLS